ncbi:hypothetical protein Avbf_12755 [Armadillidium vulgare]|nr:hypothetical protein Avbf_12755 [Armadillidium vulgare]
MYTHSSIGRTSFAAKFGAGISNICIQIWILSSKQHPRYSVTPILADLLKEPSGCFENFCRFKNISPYSCSTYSPLGTVDIEGRNSCTMFLGA